MKNEKLWLLVDSVHKKLLRARLWTTSLDDYKQDIEDANKEAQEAEKRAQEAEERAKTAEAAQAATAPLIRPSAARQQARRHAPCCTA